jgi:signal transduction histidine kinase
VKLAARYTKASLLTSLAVLLAGAVVYFFAINYIANAQLDSNLSQGLTEAEEYVKTSQLPPRQYDLDEDHAVFIKTNLPYLKKRFFDTVYHNYKEDRIEAGRAVEDLVSTGNIRYKVIITISGESTKYLIGVITIITLILLFGLLAVLFITNKYVLRGLWKPFYSTLSEIKAFNITDAQFNLKRSKVDEFTELNEAIHEMSTRIKTDYQNLKQFTENASHELMTPLAVVTTKLDTLIQDETLRPDQLTQITDIYASINKSTRLNQSLLLLIKLDNDLIKDEERLNLKVNILEKTIQFQELLQSRDIVLVNRLADSEITASKYLIDILLNNLFSNAIRHNHPFGKIEIELTVDRLTIKNTGEHIALAAGQIFGRFQKGKESAGTGLGLAVVKNICLHYGFNISYAYNNECHVFTVDLKRIITK